MARKKRSFSRLTVWNVPDKEHFFRQSGGDGLHGYLFIEDVNSHIMPFHRSSSRRQTPFRVIVSDPALEVKIRTLFQTRDNYGPNSQPLTETVFDFIRMAAKFLLVRGGRAYFEIAEGTSETNGGADQVFMLERITGQVVRFGGTFYQVIPESMHEVKKKRIPVPQSRIWVLEAPRSLGGTREIAALSKQMSELDKASRLGSEIVFKLQDFYGFDFGEFHSLLDATMLRVSGKWGWDMRMGGYSQQALEYYVYYRMLRFAHSMAVLRTDILAKMNRLLARLGYDATIGFSGIPTPEELGAAMQKMERRELSFTEASDLVYFAL